MSYDPTTIPRTAELSVPDDEQSAYDFTQAADFSFVWPELASGVNPTGTASQMQTFGDRHLMYMCEQDYLRSLKENRPRGYPPSQAPSDVAPSSTANLSESASGGKTVVSTGSQLERLNKEKVRKQSWWDSLIETMPGGQASGSRSTSSATVWSGDAITTFDGWSVTFRPSQFSRSFKSWNSVPMTFTIKPPVNMHISTKRLEKYGIKLQIRMTRTLVEKFLHSDLRASKEVHELLTRYQLAHL